VLCRLPVALDLQTPVDQEPQEHDRQDRDRPPG
jgi:hypothetical protein